ncbi:MAG: hypothetical protein ACPHLK_04500 [Gammaproteobacteria bacterium]|jgi:hypothetical protein
MAKAIIQYISISVIAFITAIISSQYVIDKVYWDQEYITYQVGKSNHNAILVSKALKTIEQLENNNLEGIYKDACYTISLFTEHLKPALFEGSPTKQKEIVDLKQEALEIEKVLRSEGRCYE